MSDLSTDWSAHTHVQLTKLAAVNTPERMLPTNYWLWGVLAAPIKVGEPIQVLRYRRAAQSPEEQTPVDCEGIFISSPVIAIKTLDSAIADVHTFNSVWRVEVLEEKAPQS